MLAILPVVFLLAAGPWPPGHRASAAAPAGASTAVIWTLERGLPLAASYPVSFQSSGLPCCDSYSVTFDGLTLSGTDYATLTFDVANGTYPYVIGPTLYYVPTATEGNVTVAGVGVHETIYFVTPVTYPLQFNQTGLPSSASWQVQVHYNDVPGSSRVFSFSGSNGYFNARNDTYGIVITGPTGWGVTGGTLSVRIAGQPRFVDVSFHVGRYDVTAQEVGLAPGTSWTFAVSGHGNTSTTSSIVDFLNNGTYPYTIVPVPGYTASPSGGTVIVSGMNTQVYVQFTAFRFPVNATESGLPTGQTWTISVAGSNYSSSTPSVQFTLPNGTYNFSLVPIPGYTTTFAGEFSVSAGPVLLPVAWTQVTYPVVFTETGLTGGTTWSVVVDGVLSTSSTRTVDVTLANGTHTYRVEAPGGYVGPTGNYTLTVAGSGLSEPVTFNATASSTPGLGGSVAGVPLWAVLGIVVAAIGGAAAVLVMRRRRA